MASKQIKLAIWFLSISLSTFAQIKSGPMVGYSDMKEVMLWVQTQQAAKVKAVYWEQGNTAKKWNTDEFFTKKDKEFTAHLVCNQVQPSKKYDYEIWVNGKRVARTYPLSFQTQTLWQFRTDPPAFKFAVGSCTYINQPEYDRPGTPYGGNYDIFTSIYQQKPDFMLWTGDNIYLREPDWNTRKGIYDRYSHMRATPELQPLLGSVHHYAIWDDHDYGNNDSDRSFWNKRLTLEAFKDFWANPNYIFENEGITGTFDWNDCQFFMLDDRWWRSPNDYHLGKRDYFGDAQFQWLIDALINSKAPFKFVVTGGQILNPTKVFENMSNYEEEHAKLLKAIADANIKGVIFLTGDRHHTAFIEQKKEGQPTVYDLTVSPLTSGPAKPKPEEIANYVEGTLVTDRNFATLEVSGKRKERVLKISVFGTKGDLKWTKEIKE
jgi:alkaline phosphatase D